MGSSQIESRARRGVAVRGWRAAGGLLVLAACSAGSSSPDHGPSLWGPYATEVEAEIRSRGSVPAREDIVVDAMLLTAPRPSEDRFRRLTRDTIRGGARVAAWLDRRRLLDGDDPFELATRRVYLCDGVALQYGTYPARTERAGRTTSAEEPFAARWLRAVDGGWRLETLWLSPTPLEVRISSLATNCQRAR